MLRFILLLLFRHSVVSNSSRLYGLQHGRLPCLLLSLRACSDSCPLSWWSRLTTLSSVIPFSSCLQSFSASESFLMSLLLISGAPSTGASASASVFLMNIQDWFPLGWTGWISLQSKGFSRVFSNNTVQKHQFFGAQPSLWSNSHIHTRLLEKPIALTIWTFVFSYMLNNNTFSMYDVSCGNPWTDTREAVLCDMKDMTFGARRPASISALSGCVPFNKPVVSLSLTLCLGKRVRNNTPCQTMIGFKVFHKL